MLTLPRVRVRLLPTISDETEVLGLLGIQDKSALFLTSGKIILLGKGLKCKIPNIFQEEVIAQW